MNISPSGNAVGSWTKYYSDREPTNAADAVAPVKIVAGSVGFGSEGAAHSGRQTEA